MILLLGKNNCSRCDMVKSILDNKAVEYQYKKIEDYSKEEQDKYLELARINKQMGFPLIIKDGKIITIQEV
jgi:glutaredoxin